jgi:hypothetical protein
MRRDTFCGEEALAAVITVRVLRQGDFPELTERTPDNHKGLSKRRRETGQSETEKDFKMPNCWL